MTLPINATLIPILLTSDQTHLTNFSGDKKLWPVYISIGNITSDTRNKPSMHAWIPLALLPIPPKRIPNIAHHSIEQEEMESLQVTHDILSHILRPLADAQSQNGYEMICADEQIRLCFPRLSAWLGDHMELATIHSIASNRCPVCVAPTNDLGEIPDTPYEPRPTEHYIAAYNNSDIASLRSDGVKNISNALWQVSEINPPSLVRADMLHTIHLGIMKHLMEWLQDFLKLHGQLNVFDQIWMQLPPYPGFTQPKKSYRSVTQWQGKEMRNLGRAILGAFTAALCQTADVPKTTAKQKLHFCEAILCIRYLTDFSLIAQYRQHTPGSIQSMKDYLRDFHHHKSIFLRFRVGKVIRNTAAAAVKHFTSENASIASASMSSTQRKKHANDTREEREELLNEILTEGAHYNFPKMHLLSHYAEQIEQFGSLHQWSTEICEALHKPFKDAYRRSNHVNATPQILNTYTRDHGFQLREKNIEAWANEIPLSQDVLSIIRAMNTLPANVDTNLLKMHLQGQINLKLIYSLETLAYEYNLSDLVELTLTFLRRHAHQAADAISQATDAISQATDASSQATYLIEAFT